MKSLFDNLLPAGFSLIPQRGDTFGERLLHTAHDLFACGLRLRLPHQLRLAHRPHRALPQAIEALATPATASSSAPRTTAATTSSASRPRTPNPSPTSPGAPPRSPPKPSTACRRRDRTHGSPPWYDVDDADSLDILRNELLGRTPPPFAASPGYPAPNTRDSSAHCSKVGPP